MMRIVLGFLFELAEYSPRRWFLLHYAFFCSSALGIIFLLLNRGHYSIDCILGYWFTTRIWWVFHTLANNESLKCGVDISSDAFNSRSTNYLSRAWWWWIFHYFECNVPHDLPLKHSVPLPQKIKDSRPIQYMTSLYGNRNNVGITRNLLPSGTTTVGYSTMPQPTTTMQSRNY